MPEVFSLAPNRREFLLQSTLAGLSLAVAGCATRRMNVSSRSSLKLALLSDTHIPADPNNAYRGFKPVENLARVLPAVQAMQPEGVILNGDAARLEGRPEDYAQLRTLLSPLATQTPVYIGLGNHDDREPFLKAFADQPGQLPAVTGKHVMVLEHPAVRIIQLDSLLYVNKVAGLLGQVQRAWLDAFLASADMRPTVLFVHHTLGDGDGELLDAGRLFALLKPHGQVKAIFYGHSHVWEITTRQRLKLVNLPAVGYNFNDDQPVGWVAATFHEAGVELTLHAVGGNTVADGRRVALGWS
jgi:Icc protein